MDVAVRAEGLGKQYRLGTYLGSYGRLTESLWTGAQTVLRRTRANGEPKEGAATVWALRDVSFEIAEGEVVGIIGPNGAGKTTLLKILSRITEPTEGRAEVHGRIGSLLEVGTGFHPELTGRENTYLNGAILGMRKREIERKFDEIVSFAEIDTFIDTPVKRYSSGMYMRLAFSVAAHLDPEVLVVDEVLAVGDAAFQQKCLGKMDDIARTGRTVLFVSHNMGAVRSVCTTGYLLDDGRVAARGAVADVIDSYTSAVDEERGQRLGSRTDRRGNGSVRLLSLNAEGGLSAERIICGSPAAFVIEYEAPARLRNVRIGLSFYTTFGEGVLQLDSDLVGSGFSELPESGEFRCTLDKVPLMPGTYSVNVFCSVQGATADWILDAATIHVETGDFFGTGRLPPKGYGSVVVPHDWQSSGRG